MEKESMKERKAEGETPMKKPISKTNKKPASRMMMKSKSKGSTRY